MTDRILAASGHAPNTRYVANNVSIVDALAAASVGIATVPELALRLMDTVRLRSVPLHSPKATRELGILVRKQHSLSAAAQRFLDALQHVKLDGSA